MKFRKLFIFLAFVLVVASCKKDLQSPYTPPGKGDTIVVKPVPYTVVENFETGTKGAYAIANVQLNTGLWSFNDAVIGSLAADVKDGNKAVRLRTGDITMKFDIKGVSQISIKHAKYGADAASTWQLLMSTDSGTTFTQLGTDIAESNTALVTDSFKVTATGKVRFQIKKQGTSRINIDDITFKGLGDPGIVVGAPDTGGSDTTGNTGTVAADRGITAGADAPPAAGDNSNILLGNPSDAQPTIAMNNNYLIDQKYYEESYSAPVVRQTG
ncbi:hypothetical protein [Mucilaginibacter sp. FT3.2]|uniref:hypothetical protein n=1 Tax=Mucilaginibacter sp. FT3.2 TaxID=2723090 RepID=UPI0018353F11|nr:hypothetical protein [Mucilaginibacter sp. FT3.2]MBB6234655.1 hypothetical protein [Mucilaginibacter sp. FT3.2]